MFNVIRLKRLCFLFILGLLSVALIGCGSEPTTKMEGKKETRIIHMTAIEPKGGTNSIPFPDTPLPEGGGYILKEPDEDGRWEAATYRWEPGLVVAYEGEQVELHIFGVNGNHHHSTLTGYDIDFVVNRGELTIVEFEADKPGIFDIICHDHLPSMQTQLLVLPKP
ncbi:hypothetical protein [Alkalihalobacterium sp. APHAB7]|uniref:hypothetical protein n=1 Tax=Alkalihalobacterium sp. APHAB7 TaxID=3402081 RepID=UPI003AB0192A